MNAKFENKMSALINLKMKLYLLLIFVAILFNACDKVTGPYTENTSGGTSNRKIIIQDFTGHKCTNCPRARGVIDQLSALYPDRIIPVAIHCGFYAIPKPSGPSYRYDFRTEAGNSLEAFYAIPAYPNGLVNTVAKEELAPDGSWGTKVAAVINTTSKLEMDITNTCDTAAHAVSTKIKTTAISYLNKDLFLVVFVTEDSLPNWQLVNGVDSSTYMHRHVLRKALTEPLGNQLKNGSFLTDSFIESSYTFSYSGTDWNISKLHVVAYIYDNATKEILQAEEAKILE